MMLWVIHAVDNPDMLEARMEHYPAHRAFLNDATRWNVEILMSGPLMTDDAKKPIGSLFIIDASDRKDLEAFHRNDPFYRVGIWETVTITAFDKKRG